MQAMNTPYSLSSNPQENDYYTVTQAARVLNVSPSTIWRWIEANKLSAYRVGSRKIRINKEDLSTIITPARAKKDLLQLPSSEELERRQKLVAKILKLRKISNITPLTTAQLIQQVRKEEIRSYGRGR